MPRNITISVPDELAKKMDDFPEVSWSKVAREGFEAYIIKRNKSSQ